VSMAEEGVSPVRWHLGGAVSLPMNISQVFVWENVIWCTSDRDMCVVS